MTQQQNKQDAFANLEMEMLSDLYNRYGLLGYYAMCFFLLLLFLLDYQEDAIKNASHPNIVKEN